MYYFYNQSRKFKKKYKLIKDMCEIEENLSRSLQMLMGSLAKGILPHRHEAIIYSGYISQNKDDKFQSLVPAHPLTHCGIPGTELVWFAFHRLCNSSQAEV